MKAWLRKSWILPIGLSFFSCTFFFLFEKCDQFQAQKGVTVSDELRAPGHSFQCPVPNSFAVEREHIFAPSQLESQLARAMVFKNDIRKQDGGRNGSGFWVWRWALLGLVLLVPCVVADLPRDVLQVSVGTNHALALSKTETVKAWGDNTHGECDVPPTLGQVKQVAAGDGFSVALLQNNNIRVWGKKVPKVNTDKPTGGEFKQIVAGNNFAAALTTGGEVKPWGEPAFEGLPTNVKEISAGKDFLLMLLTDGTVRKALPGIPEVPPSLQDRANPVAKLAQGGPTSNVGLVSFANQTVSSWSELPAPGRPLDVSERPVKSLATAENALYVVRTDGTVRAWGPATGADSTTGITTASDISAGVGVALVLDISSQLTAIGNLDSPIAKGPSAEPTQPIQPGESTAAVPSGVTPTTFTTVPMTTVSGVTTRPTTTSSTTTTTSSTTTTTTTTTTATGTCTCTPVPIANATHPNPPIQTNCACPEPGPPIGAIVGGVVGGLAVIGLAAGGLVYYNKRQKAAAAAAPPSNDVSAVSDVKKGTENVQPQQPSAFYSQTQTAAYPGAGYPQSAAYPVGVTAAGAGAAYYGQPSNPTYMSQAPPSQGYPAGGYGHNNSGYNNGYSSVNKYGGPPPASYGPLTSLPAIPDQPQASSKATEVAADLQALVGKKCKAIEAVLPDFDDDLTLAVGDLVTVQDARSGGYSAHVTCKKGCGVLTFPLGSFHRRVGKGGKRERRQIGHDPAFQTCADLERKRNKLNR